jgi:hypothetical protein
MLRNFDNWGYLEQHFLENIQLNCLITTKRKFVYCIGGRGGVVSIAIRYDLAGPEIDLAWGENF